MPSLDCDSEKKKSPVSLPNHNKRAFPGNRLLCDSPGSARCLWSCEETTHSSERASHWLRDGQGFGRDGRGVWAGPPPWSGVRLLFRAGNLDGDFLKLIFRTCRLSLTRSKREEEGEAGREGDIWKVQIPPSLSPPFCHQPPQRNHKRIVALLVSWVKLKSRCCVSKHGGRTELWWGPRGRGSNTTLLTL